MTHMSSTRKDKRRLYGGEGGFGCMKAGVCAHRGCGREGGFVCMKAGVCAHRGNDPQLAHMHFCHVCIRPRISDHLFT